MFVERAMNRIHPKQGAGKNEAHQQVKKDL